MSDNAQKGTMQVSNSVLLAASRSKAFYPLHELTEKGKCIPLDDNDNLPSVRSIVSTYSKQQKLDKGTLRVVYDTINSRNIIIRTK